MSCRVLKELQDLQSTCTEQKVSTYCSYYIVTVAEKYDPKFDLKINIGLEDLYFMVQ